MNLELAPPVPPLYVRFRNIRMLMSTPTIETLQKQLAAAIERIEYLEHELARIRKNTNEAIQGNAYMLQTLVAHTGCKPPAGQYFTFGTNFDVGHH
jgi:hypothetical protein